MPSKSRVPLVPTLLALAALLALAGPPAHGAEPPPVRAAGAHRQVDINSASAEELAGLPGIGESKAKAIVEYRAAEPFQSVDDLKKVKGIGDKMLEALRPDITVGAAAAAAK